MQTIEFHTVYVQQLNIKKKCAHWLENAFHCGFVTLPLIFPKMFQLHDFKFKVLSVWDIINDGLMVKLNKKIKY